MNILKWLTSFIAWLQIVASPLFTGIIIGFFIYVFFPGKTGLIIGIIVTAAGLITGIIFATRVWKKKGTVEFMSEISASPELDNFDPGKNE